MFLALLRLQWRESRLAILLLAAAGIFLPLASLNGVRHAADPWEAWELLRASATWSAWYPLLAMAAALVLSAGAWIGDHRSGHVYALTLPVARWRYLLMRYAAGGALLLAVGGILWLGATIATAPLTLPPLLHAYSGSLTLRFCLAGLTAFTLLFALNGLTPRAARLLVAALLVLVIAAAMADLLSLGIRPLGLTLDALLGPYSPLAVFRAPWMLIDV